jgi:hypothetical protein
MECDAGVFSRWHFSDMATKRQDAPRDMWKYWEGEAVLGALRRQRGGEPAAGTVLETTTVSVGGEDGWRYFEGSRERPRERSSQQGKGRAAAAKL